MGGACAPLAIFPFFVQILAFLGSFWDFIVLLFLRRDGARLFFQSRTRSGWFLLFPFSRRCANIWELSLKQLGLVLFGVLLNFGELHDVHLAFFLFSFLN